MAQRGLVAQRERDSAPSCQGCAAQGQDDQVRVPLAVWGAASSDRTAPCDTSSVQLVLLGKASDKAAGRCNQVTQQAPVSPALQPVLLERASAMTSELVYDTVDQD